MDEADAAVPAVPVAPAADRAAELVVLAEPAARAADPVVLAELAARAARAADRRTATRIGRSGPIGRRRNKFGIVSERVTSRIEGFSGVTQ